VQYENERHHAHHNQDEDRNRDPYNCRDYSMEHTYTDTILLIKMLLPRGKKKKRDSVEKKGFMFVARHTHTKCSSAELESFSQKISVMDVFVARRQER